MASIGSVFLGDRQRLRHLSSSTHSTSTPPSSPPPTTTTTSAASLMYGGRSSMSPLANDLDGDDNQEQREQRAPPPSSSSSSKKSSSTPGLPVDFLLQQMTRPKHIDPELALELRVRWLEAIVLGVKQDTSASQRKGKEREKDSASGLKHGETLMRLAENVQNRLDAAVEGNEGLKKFMEHYDQHAQYLTASFALSGVLPEEDSAYSKMTPEEMDAFLTELEPDIRAADRDMREIDALVRKGVTGAGKLPDHENLQSRLDALLASHRADLELAASLESRIASLMQKHGTSVDVLSELFIAWDDAITAAEDSIVRMERGKEERRRLGLE